MRPGRAAVLGRRMTLLRSRVVAVTAAALVLITLGYGAGLAVGATQPTSVSVCINKANTVFSAVPGTKGKCPKGTRKVPIASQGPVGPTGATGPAGPVGPGTLAFGTNTDHQQERSQPDNCYIGEITLSAGDFALGTPARGQVLSIASNTPLFAIIGVKYGGNGTTTFALPDLRSAAPNGMTYGICTEGIFPSVG